MKNLIVLIIIGLHNLTKLSAIAFSKFVKFDPVEAKGIAEHDIIVWYIRISQILKPL